MGGGTNCFSGMECWCDCLFQHEWFWESTWLWVISESFRFVSTRLLTKQVGASFGLRSQTTGWYFFWTTFSNYCWVSQVTATLDFCEVCLHLHMIDSCHGKVFFRWTWTSIVPEHLTWKLGFLNISEYLARYSIQMDPSVAERKWQSGNKPVLCMFGLLSTIIRGLERAVQESATHEKIASVITI
jgi:hypothetical protein